MSILLLEHGVSYGQSKTGTEVQQRNITQVQIREAVPPNHTPSSVSIIAHMHVEVSHEDNGVPPMQGSIQGLQEALIL